MSDQAVKKLNIKLSYITLVTPNSFNVYQIALIKHRANQIHLGVCHSQVVVAKRTSISAAHGGCTVHEVDDGRNSFLAVNVLVEVYLYTKTSM